jgi:hypothetical protein
LKYCIFSFSVLFILAFLSFQTSDISANQDDLIEILELKIDLQDQEIDILKNKNRKLKIELNQFRLDEKIIELQEDVSRIRGLESREPVKPEFLSKKDLPGFIQKELDTQYPGDSLRDYQESLILLGFLPEGSDIAEIIKSLYTEQAAGLYDDKTKRLFIINEFDLNQTVSNIILSHEICHALQDQHFDIGGMKIHRTDNDDAALAALCMLEGDATLLMGEWLAENLSVSSLFQMLSMLNIDQSAYTNAPYYLQQVLVFPYLQGVTFMNHAILKYGMNGRNMVLRKVPRSTEQVLHPEKYFDIIDEPTEIKIKDYSKDLGQAWKQTYTNVFGEIGLRMLFEQYMNMGEASYSAAGWDGDRYAMFRDTAGNFLLSWDSVWDTEKDAVEAGEAFEKVFNKLYPESSSTGEGSRECIWKDFSCITGNRKCEIRLNRDENRVQIRFSNFQGLINRIESRDDPVNIIKP